MNRADAAWFANWGRSHYDPNTRRVVLAGDPPPYVIAHEEAHARQHARRTWRYLLWIFAERVARGCRLLLEFDADAQARAELQRRGLWDAENQRAARLVMATYGITVP